MKNNLCTANSGSGVASSSFSNAKSHKAIWSSAPAEANTVESVGCLKKMSFFVIRSFNKLISNNKTYHSTEVTGAVWCLKVATGIPD